MAANPISPRAASLPARLPLAAVALTPDDLHLFNEGNHVRLYDKLGAHPVVREGVSGTQFAVWAPSASSVSVRGDFNGWDRARHPLHTSATSGIWQGFIPGVEPGVCYKYHVVFQDGRARVDKADPFAFHAEAPSKTASIVWDLQYAWGDAAWMAARAGRNSHRAPMAVYELHLGSWRRASGPRNQFLTYQELARPLAEYVRSMGFTHVEFLPVTEHPFYGSWGYQTTGYFAPTSRYGTPQDLMCLIDYLHQQGIGVLLDWVPSHFPTDEHGLMAFDGTHLYEHADPRQGIHPDWDSGIFNYGRHEVRSFLLSSALFWLDRYHADGLRVDAVASMLYLDYSRKAGEWVPNEYGGRENLAAIRFLRRLNELAYQHYPQIQMIAEESTAWPMVSRPVYVGGLGFGMKWDMGWMHDTLQYFGRNPVHRKFHHQELTFRMLYAFNENFLLPLSHDEVVHGKGALLSQMPGDEWQQFANLRLLFGYMYAMPGKKLLFMGGEFGQRQEWRHDASLDWHLLEEPLHRGLQQWVRDLNEAYRRQRAWHELDTEPAGFEWVDASDAQQSVLSFLRKGATTDDCLLFVCNLTPVVRRAHRVGVPRGGRWLELLNGDAQPYGGSGQGNLGGVDAEPRPCHGRAHSVSLTLPPLAMVCLKSAGTGA